MLQILKRELNISIVTSILYIILGIVIIANPQITLSIVGISIAVLSIGYGTVITIINLMDLKEANSLLIGIIAIVIGIALLIYPNSLIILISLGLGVWFISSSITRLRLAILLKNSEEINWLIILISSIMTLILGIAFIFTPLASATAITITSGIMLIVYSLIDLFEIIFIKKNIKIIEKELE